MNNKPLYVFGVHWLKGIFSPARLIGQHLIVYNSKIVFQSGIFRKEERIIPISKVTDIRVTKGCIGGVLKFGNLYLETAGTMGTEIIVMDIEQPDYARDLIVHLVEKNS